MIQPMGGQDQLFPVVVTRWQPFPTKLCRSGLLPAHPLPLAPGPCQVGHPFHRFPPAVVLLEEMVDSFHHLLHQT